MAIGHLLVDYPSSQDDDDKASTADSTVSPLATPRPSKSKPRHSTLPKKVRQNGIWSQNFSLPKPLKSPARSPIKRRATVGEIIVVDVSSFSQSQKKSSANSSQAENHPETSKGKSMIHIAMLCHVMLYLFSDYCCRCVRLVSGTVSTSVCPFHYFALQGRPVQAADSASGAEVEKESRVD